MARTIFPPGMKVNITRLELEAGDSTDHVLLDGARNCIRRKRLADSLDGTTTLW